MITYPRSAWNFEALEVTIDSLLPKVDVKQREGSSFSTCLICTNVGSSQDIKEVLSDNLLTTSDVEECCFANGHDVCICK